jgi:hypothetical protein
MDCRAEVQRWLDSYLGPLASTVRSEDILGSIGSDGDDANEIMEEFAKRFEVDMASFNPWHHFNADEPPFFRRYRPHSADGIVLPILPITISDLAAAAESGKWMKSYSGRELRLNPAKGRYFRALAAIILLLAILTAIR